MYLCWYKGSVLGTRRVLNASLKHRSGPAWFAEVTTNQGKLSLKVVAKAEVSLISVSPRCLQIYLSRICIHI